MTTSAAPPTAKKLEAVLGSAQDVWTGIVDAVEGMFAPLDKLWKPSKSEFGRMCLLQHKKRTLLYLTPDADKVWVAIVLGGRSYELAMASAIPAAIKKLLSEAKPYAEGRGIRFPVSDPANIPVVATLVRLKTAPTAAPPGSASARRRPRRRDEASPAPPSGRVRSHAKDS